MATALERPVIVLGAPRAGTSILGRILQQHPAFVHVKEPRLIWRYGNDGRSDQLSLEHARPEVVRYIRERFGRLVTKAGGGRLLEKTPSNSLRVAFVNAVFPDAQFVHITRNGFESALSIREFWLNRTASVTGGTRIDADESILMERLREIRPRQIPYYAWEFFSRLLPNSSGSPAALWGPRLPGLAAMVRDMPLIEVAAMQWRQCVELARQDGAYLGPERYMEIRLENLNSSNASDVLGFLGLEMDEAVSDYMRREFRPEMVRGRSCDLSDETRIHLRRVLAPTMAWLGYEEP